MKTISPLLALSIALLAGCGTISKDKKATEQSVAPDSQWLMRYYKAPKPDDIALHLSEWQKQGMLGMQESQSVLVGFLSSIMRSNPDKVVQWLQHTESFPEVDRSSVLYAAWLSKAPEAQNYLKRKGLAEFATNAVPDASAFSITDPSVLDFYWGAYFATGDPSAIRRIISALEFQKDSGAIARFQSSHQTEADKRAALNEAIFQAAMWSLTANSKQDEEVFAACKALLAPDKLPNGERMFLAIALSQARPDEIKVDLQDGQCRIELLK